MRRSHRTTSSSMLRFARPPAEALRSVKGPPGLVMPHGGRCKTPRSPWSARLIPEHWREQPISLGRVMAPLDELASVRRWIAWRIEDRNGKATKVPYAPQGGKAKVNVPRTWDVRAAAEARAKEIVNGSGGGIGIQLGDLQNDTFLVGIDLDSCLAGEGDLAHWAARILDALPTYAEKSPSGRGIKVLFYVASEAVRPFLDRIGVQPGHWGCRRGVAGKDARDHGPAVEVYVNRRYFAVTGDRWLESPDHVATLDGAQLDRLAELILPLKSPGSSNKDAADTSRSACAFRIGLAMRGAGKSFDEFCEAVRTSAKTASWYADKGVAGDSRELHRIWDKAAANGERGLDLVRASDIVAQPVRWLWPGRIARGKVTMLAGDPGVGKSQLALAIAAIVTTAGEFPVDGARADGGSVIIFSAEDAADDTIRPRPEAVGADLERCHILRESGGGFSLADGYRGSRPPLPRSRMSRSSSSTRSPPISARSTRTTMLKYAGCWGRSASWRRGATPPCSRSRICPSPARARRYRASRDQLVSSLRHARRIWSPAIPTMMNGDCCCR
jgi:AAA domain